ncbi:mucin-5AC-like isoform X2 [Seriola aureovittata]|uniref:mucin-5AC-like isoform X2 n=1 Tax=Seriola aureovittata TaxID=2871759 RepID=UPI0024BE4C0A|nr:mucin-5AC-like isoform X2 [Seriola aureovittata]
MAAQRAPVEVKVICFYIVKLGERSFPSPYSDKASITINRLPKPKLTVNPLVITVTDTVDLHCQTSSVAQCFFYIGKRISNLPCLTTLSGTELLNMAHQSPPTEVEVICYYSVGERNSVSSYSDAFSVTINNLIVSGSRAPTPVTPASLTSGQTVGKQSNPGSTISTSQTSVKPTLETDTGMTPMNPESGDETTGSPGTKDSSFPLTQLKRPSAQTMIWMLIVVTGCGVALGVIILLSAVLRKQKKAGSEEVKSQQSQNLNSDTYHLYSTISEEPVTLVLGGMAYSTVTTH